MDAMLPAQQSLTACQAIKNNPKTECVPIVFLAYGHLDSNTVKAESSLNSGASDFISAHQNPGEIVARLESVIRQKRVLEQQANLVEQLNQMNAELYERNLRVEKELYTTRQLQQSLLPTFLKEDDRNNEFSKCHFKNSQLRISGVYLPCDALGGDIYDVIQFQDQAIGVTIADVSGHGVPAGFVTALFKSSFYRMTHNYSKPGDILYHLNNELAAIVKTGEYVTASYCRLQKNPDYPEQFRMDFSGAGHPYPILYTAETGTLTRLTENGTPLVWVPNFEYPMGQVDLKPGDKIFLFTDGVSEMRNQSNDMFGEEALEKKFLSLIQDNNANLLDDLILHLSDFTGGRDLDDDVSIVLIEVLG
jgi:sigma-B regulation protein RsbU (phosphoserine phosphatase)